MKTFTGSDEITKPASMTDVARLANVSQVTVSRVFSGGPVAEKTRRKIEQAARKLNFSPNALARGLRGSRTKTMALVWSQCTETLPFVREITLPMQDRGYVVQIADHLGDPTVLKNILVEYAMRGVDALVLELTYGIEQYREIKTFLEKFPAVVLVTDIPFDRHPTMNVDCVSQDHSVSIKAVIDHFVKTGRTRLSYITHVDAVNQNKIDVFTNYVAQHGLPPRIANIPADGLSNRNDQNPMIAVSEKLFGGESVPPDAVLCDNNDRAFALMAYLKSKGYRIPQDVAVIGREDTFAAACFDPPLASTQRQYRKVAQRVEWMLSRRLKDASLERQVECLPMEFIWRESAG